MADLVSYIGNSSKRLMMVFTDNPSVFIRTWVPYIGFMTLNILLVTLGIFGIVIAVILDVMTGLYIYRQNLHRDMIVQVIEQIENGDFKAKADPAVFHGDNISLAKSVNSIGDGIEKAVNRSMKDEKLKADLITNVSHDIKTPLTSIINYVDLIKREEVDNVKVREYLDVLDVKSQKLKRLTEDLVEVSKITSGNISISLTKINFVEMINQTLGEFYEKFEKSGLTPVFRSEDPVMEIMADPRHLWRVLENLINNVCKYALAESKVYLNLNYDKNFGNDGKYIVFSIRNISATELNLDEMELSERFIRGDVSRTTEGSGLGLAIAKSLTVAQGGSFVLKVDGDMFTAFIRFKMFI